MQISLELIQLRIQMCQACNYRLKSHHTCRRHEAYRISLLSVRNRRRKTQRCSISCIYLFIVINFDMYIFFSKLCRHNVPRLRRARKQPRRPPPHHLPKPPRPRNRPQSLFLRRRPPHPLALHGLPRPRCPRHHHSHANSWCLLSCRRTPWYPHPRSVEKITHRIIFALDMREKEKKSELCLSTKITSPKNI